LARTVAQLCTCLARRGFEQVERAPVVVRDQLGVVVRTAERLDPRNRGEVLLRARRARNLPVRDLTHEHVAERVLGFARDGRAALAPDETFALERVQRRSRV